MQQLSLLDLPPVEDEPEPVTHNPIPITHNPLPLTSAERHTLRWLHARANYYLRLMNRFMDGKRCSQEVRSAELVRVYELREEVLAAIHLLEKPQCNEQTPPFVTLTAAPAATSQQAASTKTQSTKPSTAAISASLGVVG